jgi:hypothetical protein
MKTRELKKLIKTKEPQEILNDYMQCKCYLTDKQLSEVIALKKGTPQENRGGTYFDYGKDKEN